MKKTARSCTRGMLFAVTVAAAGIVCGEPGWKIPLERSAVVFDAPNGPPCTKLKRIWNGTVLTNRFTTGRPEYVMPFGAGNLSGLASFGDDALEIHLSQADWLTPEPQSTNDRRSQLNSPGHLRVAFAGLSTNLMTRFAQKMDMARGRLVLDIGTAQGDISAEMFGDRATGALVVTVDDRRAGVAAPAVKFEKKMPSLTLLGAEKPSTRYRLVAGSTAAAAREAFDADAAAQTAARDAWWAAYWDRGWIALDGDSCAQLLERLWYVNLYAYANVGYARMPPKFNGGPGIIDNDTRCWGRDVWWQNTREMIWPMAPANRPEFAKRYLEFYADCLSNLRGEIDALYRELKPYPGVVVLPETMNLLRSPLYAVETLPAYDVASPYRLPTDEERAVVRKARAARTVSHVSHVFSSGTELIQQMVEYVRFTGDSSFLPRIAVWLRSQTELYLVILEKGEDGRYHTHATNVNESWWLADDSLVDLAAARFCLAQTVAHGDEFGFPKELVDAAKDRLPKIADYPRGRPYAKYHDKAGLVFVDGAEVYHPCVLTKGMRKSNFENNELYLIHPFAMANIDLSAEDRDRALATYKSGPYQSGGFGWTPVGVAVARLRLPQAPDVVFGHACSTCRWPYGGGCSPGTKMYNNAAVEDTIYMDGSGVMQTAVQELLLQSHAEEPDANLWGGGPVRFIPCVPACWSGSFRLAARGGFIVMAAFEKGALVKAEIESTRGGQFTWLDPKDGSRMSLATKAGERFMVPLSSASGL